MRGLNTKCADERAGARWRQPILSPSHTAWPLPESEAVFSHLRREEVMLRGAPEKNDEPSADVLQGRHVDTVGFGEATQPLLGDRPTSMRQKKGNRWS